MIVPRVQENVSPSYVLWRKGLPYASVPGYRAFLNLDRNGPVERYAVRYWDKIDPGEGRRSFVVIGPGKLGSPE